MDPVGIGLLVAFVLAGIVLGWLWQSRRSRQLVERWVWRSGLRLVSAERRWLRRGPFWWWTGRGQEVFRVVVADAAGRERSGWVRVGGWWLGLFCDAVAVEWDPPPPGSMMDGRVPPRSRGEP